MGRVGEDGGTSGIWVEREGIIGQGGIMISNWQKTKVIKENETDKVVRGRYPSEAAGGKRQISEWE